MLKISKQRIFLILAGAALLFVVIAANGADKKISDLTTLLSVDFASGDKIPIVDVSANAAKSTTIGELDSRWFLNSGTLGVAHGGTGATTKAAGFDALSPMTSAGDLIYGATGGTGLRLAIGSTGDVLKVSGGVPTWTALGNPSPLTTKGDLYSFSTVAARLPIGANTYVLTADSTQTTGMKWAPAAPASPLTTKGDIYTFSTVEAKLAVGSDGKILTADSSQATGLSWVTPAATTPTIFGSTGTPRSIVNATGIVSGSSHMSTTAADQIIFISGSVANSENDVTANPQIQAHTVIGSRVRLIGESDTAPVLLENGTGLVLAGPWYSYLGAELDLVWDGTNYVEEFRNAN